MCVCVVRFSFHYWPFGFHLVANIILARVDMLRQPNKFRLFFTLIFFLQIMKNKTSKVSLSRSLYTQHAVKFELI